MSADDLIQQVVIAILSADAALAAIPPTPAVFNETADELPETSLTVTAQSTGKSIEVLWDYEVTVRLRTPFRGDETQSEFEALWDAVRTQIEGWYAILTTPLAILSSIDHLTIEEIEGGSEVEIADQRISRSLTFTAFIKPA